MSSPATLSVKAVASASEDDVRVVEAELARLPDALLANLRRKGIGMRVCREAVTDYRTDLKTETPRGWPPGVNWTSVPGCYCPDEHNVVIATIAAWSGERQVPPKGIKHNAWNLVLHETMHADDYEAGRLRCCNAAFLTARSADIESLTAYEAQTGQAGQEETYAESAARFFGADPSLAIQCPTLARFWREAALPVEPAKTLPRTLDAVPRDAQTIGSAIIAVDGTIFLDLRGENAAGCLGHAYLTVTQDQDVYSRVRARVPAPRSLAPSAEVLIPPF